MREQIAAASSEIRSCFDDFLATEAPTPGTEVPARRVAVEFRVDESGTFRDVVVTGPLPEIHPCIARVLTGLRVSPGPVDEPLAFATAFVFSAEP